MRKERFMGRYDDILKLQRPKSYRRPMDTESRAKIFVPFAALKGYEEALEAQQILALEGADLSETENEE